MENREVLLKYGKNPVFYSGDREDTGFLLITSGSAAQSSILMILRHSLLSYENSGSISPKEPSFLL